ncbi:MAG: hypothetical protein AAGU75_04710 [Bacillota bacterium]
MKRKFALIIVLLLTALTVAGCGNNGLVDYKKAVDKTDQIEKGQSSGEFTLNLDFNTDGMSQEDIAEMNYYKEMTGSFQSTFDDKSNQMIARNYLNLGGLGFDLDYYQNGNEMFFKLPIIGKYMKMNEVIESMGEQQGGEDFSQFISEETLQALSREWIALLNKENVFKGKDIILTTPDGEVKTTVYTITINDEQFQTLASNAMNILSKDENLKSNFYSVIEKKNGQALTNESCFDEFFANAIKQMEKDHLVNFKYTAYVDIDGYIVNETITFKITRDALEQGEPKEISFNLDLRNWDINQQQKFEFPELTGENTLKTEDLDETMPSIFKNMFQKNQ